MIKLLRVVNSLVATCKLVPASANKLNWSYSSKIFFLKGVNLVALAFIKASATVQSSIGADYSFNAEEIP